MRNYMLEVCVDSVESALAAQKGGARRLELCADLIVGGTTPGPKLFEAVRRYTKLPVHVLIRPRFGDFCYNKYECDMMREEIRMFREMGADGVVIGVLSPDGTLNLSVMEQLMAECDGMSVTLHRAFDVSADPMRTMEEAIQLGIHTILTSGQQENCSKGASLLAKLQKEGQGQIVIQAGGGINAKVIRELYPVTGITAYHMSGKKTMDSAMQYRRSGVPMGLPSLSEYERYCTDWEAVAAAGAVLEAL